MAVEPIDFSVDDTAGKRRGIHPIPLVKRTLTAFIGRTERGPVNEPIALSSFDEYRRFFGSHVTFSFVSYAVQHYFLHGGQSAVVVRVVNRATRAGIELKAGDETLYLQARHPGSQEHLRVSIDYDGVEYDSSRFNLVVQRLRGAQSQLVEDQELYPRLCMRASDDRYIVDALQHSALLRLSAPVPGQRPDATPPKRPGEPMSYLATSTLGSDGSELTDYDIIGSGREGTGLFALLRTEPIDLLCIPPAPHRDLGITSFVAAERFCERQRCMLIWDPPWSWDTSAAAVRGVRSSLYASHNALTYFPRIRRRGDLVRFAGGLPACGAIAGLLARSDACGVLRGLTDEIGALQTSFTAVEELAAKDITVLRRFGVNTLSRGPGSHYIVEGKVTLADPGRMSNAWRKLDRRRTLFFVLNQIVVATRSVHRGLDDRETVRNLEFQLTAFLIGLFKQGALVGRSASQAFLLRVVDTMDDSQLVVRVGVALQRPGEFVSYDFTYGPSGCTVRPAPALEAQQLVS